MMYVRNPFKLIVSGQIAREEMFLGLFAPGMLDIFQKESRNLWNNLYVIQRPSGGGKTTLLRLFTPRILKTLHSLRSGSEYRELFEKLKELDVLDDKGVYTLGVMLSCAPGKGYRRIERVNLDKDGEIDSVKKKKLLFGLLNSRIIISALRGVCILAGLHFPDETDSVHIHAAEQYRWLCCPTNCDGSDLLEWARKREERIFDAIYGSPSVIDDLLDNGLSSLYVITPEVLSVNDSTIKRVVVMLDDFDELSEIQKASIIDEVGSSRSSTGVWVCERPQLLSRTVIEESVEKESNSEKMQKIVRETSAPYTAEEIKQDFKAATINISNVDAQKTGESLALEIADRRLKYAKKGITSFRDCLSDTLDNDNLDNGLEILSRRIEEKISKTEYERWLALCDSCSNSQYDKMVSLRTLEILLEREEPNDVDRPHEELLALKAFQIPWAEVKTAAELFVAAECGVPYYFGWDKISTIASYTIEHFIYMCAHLFEEFLSYCLIHTHPRPLTPGDQERVVVDAAEKQITSTIDRMQEKEKIRMFIDAIGQYSTCETYRPTAPYAAGVTGVALGADDVHHLLADDEYEMLHSVISHCMNQNLLFSVPDQHGHTILYLSRLLCIRYRLPLSYGGWREKSLNQLDSWLSQGFIKRRD